jgi:hypothetical protein
VLDWLDCDDEEVGVKMVEEGFEPGEGAVLDFFGSRLDLDSFGMRLECDGEEAGVRMLDSAVLDSFRVELGVERTVCGVELFVNLYSKSRFTVKHVSSHSPILIKINSQRALPCCAWAWSVASIAKTSIMNRALILALCSWRAE